MKTCPKCNRRYKDDSLRFCLEDGSPLFSAHDSDAPQTEIITPRGAPTLKSPGLTIPSNLSGGDASTDRRQSNSVLTAGVIVIAVLLLALVGIAAVFLLRQSGGTETARINRGATPTAREASSATATSSPQTKSASDDQDVPVSSNPQPTAPLKITASASSTRLAVQSNTYYPANAIDGKHSTAWIEGVDGAGIGEWIRFDFDREIVVHRILIQPGYFKSAAIWAQNNRLAAVTAYFSDGSARELTFQDRMESQKADVGAIRTKWVRLVIKSVYYGTDPDTAISEVAFEWEP
jgi:F5/8 type C domain-containing protein